MLIEITDNPMVALNHAIAVAMVNGPQAGLDLIRALDDDSRLAGHYRLDAVRGHLYQRLGDVERARAHFRAAAEGTSSIPERNYLELKLARLESEAKREQTGRH
jgi:predicted RNA polymerase sigma factor